MQPLVRWLYFGKDFAEVESKKRFDVTYFITALFYGIGVVLAWVVNPLEPAIKQA